MKTIRNCEWCHRRLKGYGQAEVCPSCQERLDDILDRHLELMNISLTVKQAAQQVNRHPGHLRRILEHPEKYPWSYYGIRDAYRQGKEWVVFLTPLEYEKELTNQLLRIGEGVLNCMKLNAIFGLGLVLTPSDIKDLLQCQITPPPRRKTLREREERKDRLRQDPERYADQFFAAIAPFVEGKLKEMRSLRTTA